MTKPELLIRKNTLKDLQDGIYPRCVWCNGENYGPSVIAYSEGKANCYQCHKFIKEQSMFYKLRHKYDEAFRIRKGYGLSPIRNRREEKALAEFCREQLTEEHIKQYNPRKRRVLRTTVNYYDKYGYLDMKYVENNISWYWS